MDEAKGVFNAAVRKLREALDYYQLDGHVTMHCNLTLEVSELYKYASLACAARDPGEAQSSG